MVAIPASELFQNQIIMRRTTLNMLKFTKDYLLSCLILLGLASGLTGCDSDRPDVIEYDKDNLRGYFIFWEIEGFSHQESQKEFTAYGLRGEDGISVVYISPREIKNWEDICNFMGENAVFDVEEYCREQGFNDYPNTPDFFVRYKWMEINTVKSPGERDGIVTVKVDANPYKESRTLWILLRNQKSDVLKVMQAGNPDGI